ncbi:MAG: response regulator [Nodosilinea sp.]
MNFQTNTVQGDILIVDDLADNLRVLSDMLSVNGHRVRAVRNGSMALIGAKASPPDVILLDIRMPAMDGFEVCQRLKADTATQHISVIFLSALDEELDKARAFELGGGDYITKPFQAFEVQARVRHHLIIQHLQRQVIAQQAQLEALAQSGSEPPDLSEPSHSSAIRAVDTILAYADHQGQNPAFNPEQTISLQALRRQGQALGRLLATLGD